MDTIEGVYVFPLFPSHLALLLFLLPEKNGVVSVTRWSRGGVNKKN
jgi:hypothetical protein